MPGKLTPVRTELAWIAGWLGLAAAIGLVGFVSRGPTTGELVGALSLAAAVAAIPLTWMRLVGVRRLRDPRVESLEGVEREQHRWMALRAVLPLGGFSPALLMVVAGDPGDYDGSFAAVICGLIAGIAIGATGIVVFTAVAERRLGFHLLYRRRSAYENRWVARRGLSRHSVLLVDGGAQRAGLEAASTPVRSAAR